LRRRIPAILGTAVALAPLFLAYAPSASAAAGATLTVTTLGREGKAVKNPVDAVNLKTGTTHHLTSGKAHTLPDGTFDVITDIWDEASQSDTLAATKVTISGHAKKVTLDARKGHRIAMALSPAAPAGDEQETQANLCVPDSLGGEIGAYSDNGKLYVVPSSNSTLELAYSSLWRSGAGHGDQYLTAGEHKGGLPSGLSTTTHRSSLATVKVSARSGPDTGDALVELSGDSGDSCRWGVDNSTTQGTLPFSFTAHVAPGQWESDADAQDLIFGPRHTYKAGKTYSLGFEHAVWGPGGPLPDTGFGRLDVSTLAFFEDPIGSAADDRTAYKLTKGGRTLLSKTMDSSSQSTIEPHLSSAGWYTLTATAERHPFHKLPSTALASEVKVSLHFYADPAKNQQIRDYVTRFFPTGLNSRDEAAPGTKTAVTFKPERHKPYDDIVPQLSDSAKKLTAWYSTDSGKSWHAVKLTHSGGAWHGSVPNPSSGRVALRSTITDSHGDTSTTTVYRAWAIS
jgi:hypothetical protein